VKDVANIYLSSATGVGSIVAEHDEVNERDEMLPPVVPHQLAAIAHSEFCSIVGTHWECMMAANWTPIANDAMEQEHKELLRAVAAKLALHAAIDACEDGISFDDSWSIVKRRYDF